MKEQTKYEVIKKLVDDNGNKDRAAIKLNCSRRTINRMINGYKSEGKSYFMHGNRGKAPSHTIDDETKRLVIDLYQTKYYDSNFTHYKELLERYEGIKVSEGTIRNLMKSKDILSPKARRKTKKLLKKKLEDQRKQAKKKSEIVELDNRIYDLSQIHPRRSRAAYAGELIQMDASKHEWFGEGYTHLHAAIDDATGIIVGAWFDKEETLNGYYQVFNQILTEYGIPYRFLTDNRTIFEYRQKNKPSVEKDTFTQFAYACHQLGVDIKTSSIPQAKGRIERLFQTLQSRLIIELRLAGVTTIDEANEFLRSYLVEFNKRFAISMNNIKSVFETQPSEEKINMTLATITQRQVDKGNCIKFHNQYYSLVDNDGVTAFYPHRTKAVVVKAFNNKMYACINDTNIFAMEVIKKNEVISKEFDTSLLPKKVKPLYVPDKHHPWAYQNVNAFLKNKVRHHDFTFDDVIYSQAQIY